MSKGSKRRPEKPGVYQDNWEKVFGKPKPKIKERKKTPRHGVTKVHRDKIGQKMFINHLMVERVDKGLTLQRSVV